MVIFHSYVKLPEGSLFFFCGPELLFVCWLKLPKHPTWIRTLIHPHKKGTVTVFRAVHKNIRTTKTISPHDLIIVIFALYVYPFPPGDPYLISKISRISTDWWFPTSFIPVRHILISSFIMFHCSLFTFQPHLGWPFLIDWLTFLDLSVVPMPLWDNELLAVGLACLL